MPVKAINTSFSKYACRYEGAYNNTVCVIGVIQVRSTVGRPNPPQPFNTFNTSRTPFGNGHLFALSLGGTDEPANIVPQWEQWQQTGGWRKIEVECENYNDHVFRVNVTYDATAADQFNAQFARLQTDPVFDWTDPRLPTSFHVRVYRKNCLGSTPVPTDPLSFSNVEQTLNSLVPVRDFGVVSHTAMPPEDVYYWQNQVIATVIDKRFESFGLEQREIVEKQGMILENFISLPDFILHPDTKPEVQSDLKSYSGFAPTDIAGLQMDRMLNTSLKNLTAKRLEGHRNMFKKTFGDYSGAVKKREHLTATRNKSAREARLERKRGKV